MRAAELHSRAMLQWAASLLYTTFLFASTAVYGVVVLATFWLPYRRRFAIARSWGATQLAAVRILCGLDYVVEGRENLPPGHHVAMWKHSSAWETMAMMVLFPPQAWVLKQEIYWIPIVGWAVMLFRPIAVNRRARRTAVQQVVDQGRQRLDQGMWILIFPEGTRVPVGERRKFGLSGALLASQTGRMLVPVAHDAGRYWPRRGLLKKPGTIRVVIGAPIDATGRDAREVTDELKAWIDAKTTELGA